MALSLLLAWWRLIFGRGYWLLDSRVKRTFAWRISWSGRQAMPLLAGEPFSEKPPLTCWLAALPMKSSAIRLGPRGLPIYCMP